MSWSVSKIEFPRQVQWIQIYRLQVSVNLLTATHSTDIFFIALGSWTTKNFDGFLKFLEGSRWSGQVNPDLAGFALETSVVCWGFFGTIQLKWMWAGTDSVFPLLGRMDRSLLPPVFIWNMIISSCGLSVGLTVLRNECSNRLLDVKKCDGFTGLQPICKLWRVKPFHGFYGESTKWAF